MAIETLGEFSLAGFRARLVKEDGSFSVFTTEPLGGGVDEEPTPMRTSSHHEEETKARREFCRVVVDFAMRAAAT